MEIYNIKVSRFEYDLIMSSLKQRENYFIAKNDFDGSETLKRVYNKLLQERLTNLKEREGK